MIAFAMFGQPALERLLRLAPEECAVLCGSGQVTARLTGAIPSRLGRRDYARVCLQRVGDRGWLAAPVPGASASLSSLARSNGVVVVQPHVEQLCGGEEVEVTVC